MQLNGKNETRVRAGMTFNVAVGLEGLEDKEATDKPMCGHFVVDHTPHAIVCGIEVTNMGKHTTTGKYPPVLIFCRALFSS